MPYSTAEARRELLEEIAAATDEIGVALAALGEAYEVLDEHTADTLEERLFGPVQHAYGRAKRTHGEFARRVGLPGRTFAPGSPGPPSSGVKGFVDTAVRSVEAADARLGALQDSMRPVEVGDAELRAGLSEVRRLLADLPARARQIVRGIGR
jgi:hypothetical protein